VASTVLITGGAGTLGKALTTTLVERGDQVRLIDVREPDFGLPAGTEFMAADVRVRADIEPALEGVDTLIHTAAWHGIHLRDHSADDFWSLNVNGTFNVYEAAAERKVSRAVFSSTMGVYGESSRRADDAPAVRVHEDLPRLPGDIYGLSKVVGEETAAYYHRARGMRGVALRYGMFVPEPFLHYGIRILYGGVDDRDVAAAVLAALDILDAEPDRPFRAYGIHAPLPYDDEDAQVLPTDPLAVIKRHWPDGPELLEAAETKPWGPVNSWYDVNRAQRELGWRPRYDFGTFLGALRAGIERIEEIPPRDAAQVAASASSTRSR
jgi:nucleoside-diphosphate-sugar epimerase